MLKRKVPTLMLFCLCGLLLVSTIKSSLAQSNVIIGVDEGAWVKYGISGSGAYLSYDGRQFYMTVTEVDNVNGFAKGTFVYNTSLDRVTAPFTNAPKKDYDQYRVNARLEPFVVKNNSWTDGPIATGIVHDKWKESSSAAEIIYFDVPRQVINFTYYNFETWDSDGNRLKTNMSYYWDIETGILCEWDYVIVNLDDPILSGEINWKLSETSEWELTTGAIPGYSFLTLVIGIAAGAILILGKAKFTKGRRHK